MTVRSGKQIANWPKQRYNFRHNGLTGTAGMVLSGIRVLSNAESVTPRGHVLAKQMEGLAIELADEVYTYRIEPDGTRVTPEHREPHPRYTRDRT